MKFNIEVDLENLVADMVYDEEQCSLTEVILSTIRRDVLREVNQKLEAQIRQEVTAQVIQKVQDELQSRIAIAVDKIVSEGVLYKDTKDEIKIGDYIYSIFTSTPLFNQILPSIRGIAEKFAQDVKKQYDVAFATSIVMKLKETGMLDKDKLQQLFKN